MPATPSEELVDAVYRVVFEPQAWGDVLQLMSRRFPSSAQSYYCMRRSERRIEAVCLNGVEARWVPQVDSLYFTPDNPWLRLTERLHRPGVVRTNERLDRVLGERGALYRSTYYHEWMRPQRFHHTLGNTALAEGDLVANVTLFRPVDMPTFSAAEVRGFEALSAHMTRALQMALRLGRPEASPAVAASLDAMAQPVAVVDGRRRLRHANARMETLLRARDGLGVEGGVVVAAGLEGQAALASWFDALVHADDARRGASGALVVRGRSGSAWALNALPLAAARPGWLHGGSWLLSATRPEPGAPLGEAGLQARHGCTRAEARLAGRLAAGRNVREAADDVGLTYESARTCLKRVYAKTGARGQARLVALMLGGAADAAA